MNTKEYDITKPIIIMDNGTVKDITQYPVLVRGVPRPPTEKEIRSRIEYYQNRGKIVR
jgi:hypothetical protein